MSSDSRVCEYGPSNIAKVSKDPFEYKEEKKKKRETQHFLVWFWLSFKCQNPNHYFGVIFFFFPPNTIPSLSTAYWKMSEIACLRYFLLSMHLHILHITL